MIYIILLQKVSMLIDQGPIPLSNALRGMGKTAKRGRRPAVNKRVLYLSIQSIANAIIISIVAKGLIYLIDLITNISFHQRFSIGPASPADHHLGWLVIFVPIAGAIIVGLMARYGSKAIGGHGIPEAMEKIILEDSKIPPILIFLKPVSAAISIGTGGPFGAEGPIIATGGAFGSLTGQWMHITAAERKIILAAGACAGMAAIFGSPFAALLLAVELLLFEFSPRSIIPVALGCVTGACMHLLLFGNEFVFHMPAIAPASISQLMVFVLFGGIIGIAASFISKSVYLIEDLFEKSPVHWMWWPALGAIAIGITGYFAPRTMGVGYENITGLLAGSLPLTAIISLFILKYISWAIALGSGTSGGTLAPLLTIGGALGALLAITATKFFPALSINIGLAALVGMAAMFAGASRALLTAVVFVIETTGEINGILPVFATSIVAYFISFFLMKGSIMTEKIKRRGVKTPDSLEPDVLQTAFVRQLATPVKENPIGLPFVYEADDVGFAAEMMGKYHTDTLAVKENKHTLKTTGIITSAAILSYYSARKQKDYTYHSPGKVKRLLVHGRKIFIKNA